MGPRSQDRSTTGSAANTCCYVQVLGVGNDTADAPPSVLLFFDHQRFLFNCGEGLQRFCAEHHVKLAKVSRLFLTRVAAETAGGLPGLLLTMADVLAPAAGAMPHAPVTLYGPPRTKAFVAAARLYVNARDLALTVQELPQMPEGPLHSDELVSITHVILRPAAAAAGGGAGGAGAAPAAEGGAPPAAADGGPAPKRPRLEGAAAEEGAAPAAAPAAAGPSGPPGGGAVLMAPDTPAAMETACYVCQLPDIKGKFDPSKALALGVPKGPAYGRLVKGEAVAGAGGRLIQPSEVMGAELPGPRVIIVDCPTDAHVAALVAAPELRPEAAAAVGGPPRTVCVVHLTPAAVIAASAPYRAWAAALGPAARHVYAGTSAAGGGARGPAFVASTVQQAKLHAIHPGLFPCGPREAEAAAPSDAAAAAAAASAPADAAAATAAATVAPDAPSAAAHNLLKYHLRPASAQRWDAEAVPPPVDPAAVSAALMEVTPELPGLIAELHAGGPEAHADGAGAGAGAGEVSAAPGGGGGPLPAALAGLGRGAAELLFLGTGAAVPSKYRNVTSAYLHRFHRGGLLLDAGEGTFGQLCRAYGPARAEALVAGLQAVWISHIHADHHAGLPRILALRRRLLGGAAAPPLAVIGPRPLRRFLELYDARVERLAYVFVDGAMALPAGQAPQPFGADGAAAAAALRAASAALGLSALQTVEVNHCRYAYGLVVAAAAPESWRAVFSGDTAPCEALVAAARDATVLVHEATFEDSLQAEAVDKRHSVTRDAVACGARAGAYRTILTHFSQRYPKVPVFDGSYSGSTGVAFDLMAVNWADLPLLPRLLPALKAAFKDEMLEDAAPPADGAEPGAGAA